MRKLMLAIASAVAIGFSASAESQAWFNGGIAAGWPDAATGGAWSNHDNQAELNADNQLELFADATNPVVFTVASPKTLKTDAKTLRYDAEIDFTPFTSLTNVSANALAGVAVVTNEDLGGECKFWVLAQAADGGLSNEWVETSLSYTNAMTEVSIEVNSDAGANFGAVTYTLGENDFATNIFVNTSFSKMEFTGDGVIKTLSGEFDDEATLTLSDKYDLDKVVVTVLTNGIEVTGQEGPEYILAIGSEVEVLMEAKTAYRFADGQYTKSDIFTLDRDIDKSAVDPEMPTYAVATIANEYYFWTLQEALTAATGGDEVELLQNVTTNETLVVADKDELWLNLNDFTLTSTVEGYAIVVSNTTLYVEGGTIVAADCGIRADGESGLEIQNSSLTAVNRAVHMSNEGYTVENGPGNFYVYSDTTIESTGDFQTAVICANGDSDNARTVTIEGQITATRKALQLSGNNEAEICDGAYLESTGEDCAIYFVGTWHAQTGTGTRPTLTILGSVQNTYDEESSDAVAIWTDPGDQVGVNLTIGDGESEPEITCENGAAVVFQAPGSLTINSAAFTGEVSVNAEYQDMTASITGGSFSSDVVSNPHSSGLYPALEKFITGGTFYSEPTASLIADGYEAVYNESDEVWVVGPVQTTGFAVIPEGTTTTNYYASVGAALDAADDGDTVAILNGCTLDETLTIGKAVILDLCGSEVELSTDTSGIVIDADATIKNGSISSVLEENVKKNAIYVNPGKEPLFKDLTVDTSCYEYGIVFDSAHEATEASMATAYDAAPTADITCENVNVTGNGILFYAQYVNLTLKDCSAVTNGLALFANDCHKTAVYSTLNARVTIDGGTYNHQYALLSGDLGAKITVDGGSFTGDVKSYMSSSRHPTMQSKADFQAQFFLNAGTYAGNIVFHYTDAASRAFDYFKKGSDVALDAPANFVWDAEGVLKPAGAKIGTVFYLTLNDAVEALRDGAVSGTVELLAAASLDDLVAAATISLNGYNLTLAGDTLTNDLTVTGAAGQLVATGTKNINANLNLGALDYATQLAGNTGVFAIAAGCTVTLPVSQSVKDLAKTGMFAGSSAGAIVTTLDGTATFDGIAWLKDGEYPWDVDANGNFMIATADDLRMFQSYSKIDSYIASNFVLTADIDLKGEVWTGICQWVNSAPLGNAHFFKGVFDGQNHKIYNFSFEAKEYHGFFKGFYGATVKNLTIETNGMDPDADTSEEYGAGIFCCSADSTKFENCVAAGYLTNATHNVAGFAIKAGRGTTFVNCTNNATIASSGAKRAAGFVGFNSSLESYKPNLLAFTNCVNNGSVTVAYAGTADYGAGGFVGGTSALDFIFKDCVNNGQIAVTGDPAEKNTTAGTFIGKVQTRETGAQLTTLTVEGCSAAADQLAVSVINDAITVVNGFSFATTNGNVATFCAPALGNAYKVMSDNAAYEFEEAGTITFDETLAVPAVTAVTGLTVGEPAGEADARVYTAAATQIALTITQVDDATNATVKVNGADPAATYDYGSDLTVVVSAKDGWEYAAESYEGWELAEGVLTTNIVNFTEAATIVIPAPTAKSAGPVTPSTGGGSVDPVAGEPGVYEVTADPASKSVTIVEGLQATDVIRVTTTEDIKVFGVPASQIQVKIGDIVIPNGAFKGGDEVNGFDTALATNLDATVTIDAVEIKVVPQIGETAKVLVGGTEVPAFTPAGDTTSVAIQAIPGLTYTLMGGTAVAKDLPTACDSKTAPESTAANGFGIKLENGKTATVSGSQAFFQIKVSK